MGKTFQSQRFIKEKEILFLLFIFVIHNNIYNLLFIILVIIIIPHYTT